MVFVLPLFIYPAFAMEAEPIKTTPQIEHPYIEALNIPVLPKFEGKEVPPSAYCSCVIFAKQYLGIKNESWGVAINIKPTTDKPYAGGIVITKESKLGHVAVIKEVVGNELHVIEANYKHCQKSERTISMDDPDIIGYR